MGQEAAESGQSSTRRRSRTVTTEPNGGSSGSGRKETVKDKSCSDGQANDET